jgi:hypothetical protein
LRKTVKISICLLGILHMQRDGIHKIKIIACDTWSYLNFEVVLCNLIVYTFWHASCQKINPVVRISGVGTMFKSQLLHCLFCWVLQVIFGILCLTIMTVPNTNLLLHTLPLTQHSHWRWYISVKTISYKVSLRSATFWTTICLWSIQASKLNSFVRTSVLSLNCLCFAYSRINKVKRCAVMWLFYMNWKRFSLITKYGPQFSIHSI